MKLITNISGQLTEGDYRETRGAITTLHVEPVAGVHVKIYLGASGLVFQRADMRAAIPLPALTKLVFEHCPEMLATKEPEQKPNPVRIAALNIVEQHKQNQAGKSAPAKP